MFYQTVRYLLESNIRENLTRREEEIIKKSAEECIHLYNKIIDEERLTHAIDLVIIRLVCEIFQPVLHGRQKMLDTLINIFTKVRSLGYIIKMIIKDAFSNQQNTELENTENAIKKIKFKIQQILLITVYNFTPGHPVEQGINAYQKYREKEVYGLDKEDKRISDTFNDLLDEL